MSRWFRHYAGMMRDEKLVRAAVRANQPVERVVWVWGAILETSAEINDHGRYDLDPAEAAYFLRCSGDDISSIVAALEALGRLCEGRVAKWDERQYVSDGSTERVRKHRQRRVETDIQSGDNVSDGSGNANGTLQPVTVTPPETETETEEKKVRRKAPRRISYPPRFEVFWGAYPADPGMSKSEALSEWQKLSSEDQETAIASLPAFKRWIPQQGAEYRTIHACRYLKKRRFDGHAVAEKMAAAAVEAASSRVYVKYGTDAGDEWEKHYRLKGKIPPRDHGGGWWFDSEYPPENVSRQTSEDQAA